MSPSRISLRHPLVVEPYHGALAVLEVALQAAVVALRDVHPDLVRDDDVPDDNDTPLDNHLAGAIITGAWTMIDLLHCYRAIRDDEQIF